MKELRDLQASGVKSEIKVIDNWLTVEECNYLIWAFEYDGSAVLWEEVKKGDKHFPRRLTSWLEDRDTKSAPYLYSIRNRITEEFIHKYYYPLLFPTQTYLDGVVDSAMAGPEQSWWDYYSSILFLNDNFEGGDISFSEEEVSVTPRMGSLLLFPSSEIWETLKITGTSYRMLSKYTDVPAYREDDLDLMKKPFIVQNAPDAFKQKSKGCGSCTDKKMRVKYTDEETGAISYAYKTQEELEIMKRKAPLIVRGIII